MSRRQLPRAPAATLDAATFLPGEIAVDTTNDELRYDGDGSTVGGIALARKDGANLTASAARVTATGATTARTLADWFKGCGKGSEVPPEYEFFVQNGAQVWKMRDRLMLGAAADNDCSFPNVAQDWLTQFQIAAGIASGSVTSSQFAALTGSQATAAVGATFGSRSINFTSAATACIGATVIAVNNNVTYATNAWALYLEAHATHASVGSTYCIEGDIRTLVSSVTPHPFQQGDVVWGQIACGAEMSAVGQFDASCGLQFVDNPMQFKVGINFLATSIDGTDGASGSGVAIALATGHDLRWYNAAGTAVSTIATAAGITQVQGLQFTSLGPQFFGPGATAIAYFLPAASAVNWLFFLNAATGSPVDIQAAGADTDVGLKLTAKGAGLIRATNTLAPNASDGAALGATALMWSDLFLASGAVVNWNNGDVTLTHSADLLTIAGGTLKLIAGTTYHVESGDGSNYVRFGRNAGTGVFSFAATGSVNGYAFDQGLTAMSGTAIPAGGTAGAGLKLSSTANFGTFFGSGAPSLAAAKGSLYLRSDGSGVNDRAYVNTDGNTTWTALVTVA